MAKEKPYIQDAFGQKITKGSQVLFITKADAGNPFYYSCCNYVVQDIIEKDLSKKGDRYRTVDVVVVLWDGHRITKTRKHDRLLKINKLLPRNSHSRKKLKK